MNAKSGPTIACRHPKVVMLIEIDEDIAGAAKIISEVTNEFRTIKYDEESASFVEKTKPSVLLFGLSSVEKSVLAYSELVEQEVVNHEHYSVILCNNKESNLAFRCCIKGLFDNYFVYQPMYERFRLKMIVHNGMMKTAASETYAGIQDKHYEKIDEELAQLIEQSSECRQQILEQLRIKREEIENASNQVEQGSSNFAISTDELIKDITNGHIKPLLNLLESDIQSSLDQMITQMFVVQQMNQTNRENNPNTAGLKAKSEAIANELKNVKYKQLKDSSSEELEDDELPDIEMLAADQSKTNGESIENMPEQTKENGTKPGRILVVEDNQLYRDMLVNVLSREKYEVDEANDGIKAINKIKHGEYDLIIMDLFMPNLDGLNATKQIRTVSGGKDIPVIALTGNKNKDLVRKWASYGLKGYILKPSTKEQILTAVSQSVACSTS